MVNQVALKVVWSKRCSASIRDIRRGKGTTFLETLHEASPDLILYGQLMDPVKNLLQTAGEEELSTYSVESTDPIHKHNRAGEALAL